MLHRLTRASVAIALAGLLFVPSSAAAWSNGTSGPDGYGTHDWVLLEGKRIAVANGVTWLDWKAAQPVTDDPDTVLGIPYHHTYEVRGDWTYGDAPSQIAVFYAQAVYRLRCGDRAGASKKMALISHYYSDICNPLHTDYSSTEASMHAAYENDVDALTDTMGENNSWVTPGSLQYRHDIAETAKRAAASSRGLFSRLTSDYPALGEPGVRDITAWSMNRSANDIADIIYSVQRATRTPASRVTAQMASDDRYPVHGEYVEMLAKVTDSAGRPIPGVRVTFTLKFKSATRTTSGVSNAWGLAEGQYNIGKATEGYKVVVTAKATSAGVTRSGSTWFVPRAQRYP